MERGYPSDILQAKLKAAVKKGNLITLLS